MLRYRSPVAGSVRSADRIRFDLTTDAIAWRPIVLRAAVRSDGEQSVELERPDRGRRPAGADQPAKFLLGSDQVSGNRRLPLDVRVGPRTTHPAVFRSLLADRYVQIADESAAQNDSCANVTTNEDRYIRVTSAFKKYAFFSPPEFRAVFHSVSTYQLIRESNVHDFVRTHAIVVRVRLLTDCR